MSLLGSFLEFVEHRHPWALPAFLHPSFSDYFISPAVIFVSQAERRSIEQAILALNRLRHNPKFVSWLRNEQGSGPDPGFDSGFMGFDFYLTDDGPRLIEINTNAAAQLVMAFLNEFQGCVPAVEATESVLLTMLKSQFRHYGKFEVPGYSVIVDQAVTEQKTYFDMALHSAMMGRWGWANRVADITELRWDTHRARLVDSVTGQDIDYVYNRDTDFELNQPQSSALKSAWLANAVCLSPHPLDYVAIAQKSRLKLFSDPLFLTEMDASATDINAIESVLPPVKLVSDFDPELLWTERRRLFFKPQSSFGSRGCYKGDGITKKVFDYVLANDYVVQPFFVPKQVEASGVSEPMKFDLRVYAYGAQIQGWAARLFLGQVTNFRTLGGGFASVKLEPDQ